MLLNKSNKINKINEIINNNYLTELSEKSIVLPSFVDSSHCLSYNLTGKGRNIADRVVSVLGFSCPDITYSPTLYPFTALLLHFMTEEDCYHCMASLVACKDKVFVTQTKLLFEVTWKTVEQIAKKYVVSFIDLIKVVKSFIYLIYYYRNQQLRIYHDTVV